MNGLKRNVSRLFEKDGRLFVLAMDHAQCGLVEGLKDTAGMVDELSASKLDGFILNVGLAEKMGEPALLGKKLVLRTSFGGSVLGSGFSNLHKNHVSPETALELGADAVLMMMVFGGDESKALQEVAKDIDGFHRFSIPVIAEILCTDASKTATFAVQANGARVAAELGADVVKAFYTECFSQVVENCPKPVILAGGPKDKDICVVAREALQCGAKGFAFGRNIFQNKAPSEMIARIAAVCHEA